MMMKLSKQIGLLGAVICTSFMASAQQNDQKFKEIGAPAPALHISNWIKGDKITAFEKNKVYVVEFWATWCKPCIAGMPHLSELAEKYRKDVTVLGVSIMERKETPLSVIEKFVAGMGKKMDYNVATEEGKLMAENWLRAYGERGIPYSFIVDQQGRIAWCGPPNNLDLILPKVINGTWNINLAAQERIQYQRLAPIDANEVVNTLNPYMGNPGRPEAALKRIDSILAVEPGLKYFPKTGHFTFYALSKTDQKKAVQFARDWFAANDYPSYSTVTDAVYKREGLIPELYVLAADCYQAQLDHYPWSMDFAATYTEMAKLYVKAGNKEKADEMLKKAKASAAESKLAELLNQKDSVALQNRLDVLSKSEEEDDLSLLVSYYNTKQDQNRRDAVAQRAIQKFPNGLAAMDKALGEIYNETNGAENEKKYQQFMARFGSNPKLKGHRFFDSARYFVAVSFKDQPEKVMEYLNLIQDTLYQTKAFSYAARETYGRKEYVLAESLIKKSINDERKRSAEKTADYYAYAKQYAAVLYANKKYNEGLQYANEVYARDGKKDAVFNDTYLNLLVANKQFQQAYPLMEQSIKDGRASEEVKAQFKNAYIAVKGNDESFVAYEHALYEGLKEKINADIIKKMIKEPAFNFSVTDLSGKKVSLSDYKGKTVVLDFWATWCGPCKASFPHMQAAVNKFKEDRNVVFLFIHTWETDADPVKSAGDYIKSNKYSFKVLMDLKDPVTKKNAAAAGYKLVGIPAKFVIDKNGMIRFRSVGGTSGGNDAFVEEMSAMIDLAKAQ